GLSGPAGSGKKKEIKLKEFNENPSISLIDADEKALCLLFNKLTEITIPDGLKKLKNLDLSGNPDLTAINGLEKLTSLRLLNLKDVNTGKIDGLVETIQNLDLFQVEGDPGVYRKKIA
ncbi:MAG: leucine-rich repeat domain-containing protein, partial [bacterium]